MTGGRPLVIGITDLIRQPGVRRPVARSVVLDGLAISTASVPHGGAVMISLELESVSGGLVADGVITVPWEGECRRCLDPVVGTAVAEVREIFERRPTDGDTYPLANDTVDLEPMVRDAVLLALPLAPLCTDGCRGPAPDVFPAGVTTVEGSEPTGPEVVEDEAVDLRPLDPRWAALDELTFGEGSDGDR